MITQASCAQPAFISLFISIDLVFINDTNEVKVLQKQFLKLVKLAKDSRLMI